MENILNVKFGVTVLFLTHKQIQQRSIPFQREKMNLATHCTSPKEIYKVGQTVLRRKHKASWRAIQSKTAIASNGNIKASCA